MTLCSKLPVITKFFDPIPASKTAMITPAEAMPNKPKLSSSEASLSFFSTEIPTPRARIKGTVRAPVVAPEASKAMARYSGEV